MLASEQEEAGANALVGADVDVHALLRDVGPEGVRKVAVHVGSRICTPRDMGAAPACRLRQALAAIHDAA